jgi:hypothetical protein
MFTLADMQISLLRKFEDAALVTLSYAYEIIFLEREYLASCFCYFTRLEQQISLQDGN